METMTKYQKDTIKRAIGYIEENMKQYRGFESVGSPREARELAQLVVGGELSEAFAVMFFDNQHKLIAQRVMFRGTIDGASIHPREVVKAAIESNASAVILAHNHPSGSMEPSGADIKITDRLKSALGLIDVRVLDHLICGNGEAMSFAERGLL
jgi:DNA repair protein RadC